MLNLSTLFHRPSNESNVIDDTDYEAPALETGATMFWQDSDGYWQTVEVTSCEPRGWGFAQIKWHTLSGWHTKSVPFLSLCDLDTYLDQSADYSAFELAAHEADVMED